MRISIFGLGYVGSISAACLARLGHQVIGLDTNPRKTDELRRGIAPVYEPGLQALLDEGLAAGRIQAGTDLAAAVAETDLSFVCVGTPPQADGSLDNRQLAQVIQALGAACRAKSSRHLIVVRSTALPATHQALLGLLGGAGLKIGSEVGYVVHPEFLREGNGVEDFFAPGLVVFGGATAADRLLLEQLYPGLPLAVNYVERDTAALAKYADNLFHAAKITFANEMGQICRLMGVDSRVLMDLVKSNTRANTSAAYLTPGLPFGGSCLPKDLGAFLHQAAAQGLALPMLAGVQQSNLRQMDELADWTAALGYRSFLFMGVSFKADTDDLRGSPLVHLAGRLLEMGRVVRIYAPELCLERLTGANMDYIHTHLPGLADLLVADAWAALAQADAVVVDRRLPADLWAGVQKSGAALIDLVGTLPFGAAEPAQPRHGLYW